MSMPFTTAQFLDAFGRYNEAVWPAQVLFLVAALVVVGLALRPAAHSGRVVSSVLAFFWAWMGVVYHCGFFSRINPAAYVFAALFVLEAGLLVHAGVMRSRLSFRARGDAAGITGAILVSYALVLYPFLGYASGQDYPRMPTFGLPCPTTIFTLGVLLWATPSVPLRLLVIPAAWSLLGASAASSHGIVQDYGLLVAGLAATALVLCEYCWRSPLHGSGSAWPGGVTRRVSPLHVPRTALRVRKIRRSPRPSRTVRMPPDPTSSSMPVRALKLYGESERLRDTATKLCAEAAAAVQDAQRLRRDSEERRAGRRIHVRDLRIVRPPGADEKC